MSFAHYLLTCTLITLLISRTCLRGNGYERTLVHSHPRLESKPTSNSGHDGNRGLHIRVNVAVISERSWRREGKHEGLIRSQIIVSTKDSSRITGCRVYGIGRIDPHHLCSHFDRERCRAKGVLVTGLNDLDQDHRRGRRWGGGCCRSQAWSRRPCTPHAAKRKPATIANASTPQGNRI